MDLNRDLRHNITTPINGLDVNNVKLRRINLAALFFIQFLLSSLVLSYGLYAIFFMNKENPILETITCPLFFLATTKLFSPWLRDISDTLYENYFRVLLITGTLLCSSGIMFCYFFEGSFLISGLLYGILGGFGATLILMLINSHLEDVFPYQNKLVQGVKHLGTALSLFIMPHVLQTLLSTYKDSSVFLIHGAFILHILPAGFLLRKRKIKIQNNLQPYNNLSSIDFYEEEMIEISNDHNLNLINERNWKSPSDKTQNFEENEEKEVSSPILQRLNINVNILPQIIEEDENEDEEEINKRNSILFNNNLKRMSVISTKLEEIIHNEENDNEIKKNEDTNNELIINANLNFLNENKINFIKESTKNENKNACGCSPYQSFRFRRRVNWFFSTIFKLTILPVFKSLKIIEFYPCLLTSLNSLLSPLIFLNFVAFKTYFGRQLGQENNLTELSFMYSIAAFGYLVFLIILPWVSDVPKRNLKYFYMCGCIFSAVGVYLCVKTRTEDYLLVSCLIYGFGFGMETYLKDVIIKETLGVNNWSKTENSLEILTGILLIITVFGFRQIIPEENIVNFNFSAFWLDFIFINHIVLFMLWIIFPGISYLFNNICFNNFT